MGIHHVFINVKDLGRSREFYGWLMPLLGYGASWEFAADSVGWLGASGSFWIKRADPEFASDEFHKDRVGLCEIAFGAESQTQVDEMGRELRARGVEIIEGPKLYPYVPGYYAVFFRDPDGIKLELAHIPGFADAG